MKIISAYKSMKAYAEKATSLTGEELSKAWDQIVIAPYWEQWAAGQFNEERIREDMKSPTKEFVKIKEAVELLEAAEIEKMLQSCYEKINTLLPAMEPDTAICIYIDTELDLSTGGIVGSCVGDNMLLRVNPFIKDWEKFLPWVVAHEHHHSVWGYDYFFVKGNKSTTFLTSIICEGMADSFGKMVSPDISPAWISAIDTEEESIQWQELQAFIHAEPDYNTHVRFFFGGENTPAYTGYTIGFNIVQEFMRNNPDAGLRDMLEMNSAELLERSGYNKKMS